MNIGFASIYSSRPFPHFIAYLEHLAREGGASTFSLTCDGAIGTCYNHLLRNRSKQLECAMCKTGGLRSFPIANIRAIDKGATELLSQEAAKKLAYSSAVTLSRAEAQENFLGPQVRNYQDLLAEGIRAAYSSARRWINDKKLDALVVYNGRIDATAALAAACKDEGKRLLTVERSGLVGHGIWLVPDDNCLALHPLEKTMTTAASKPLKYYQAELAARFLALRLQRRSDLEWRVYNKYALPKDWPNRKSNCRILVLPSSRNEFEGSDEWRSPYSDLGQVLKRLCDERLIKASDCVVRGHPIWAERIGAVESSPANEWWSNYCSAHSLHYIPSDSSISTQDLIRQADVLLINGSSAAIEAGTYGKRVFCFGRSQYEQSGIAYSIRDEQDWSGLDISRDHDARRVVRQALRYVYWIGWRYPQFVQNVRGITSTRYEFRPGANPIQLFELLKSGQVKPDDELFADNDLEENAIVEDVLKNPYKNTSTALSHKSESRNIIKRRFPFQPIDTLRSLLPIGDK